MHRSCELVLPVCLGSLLAICPALLSAGQSAGRAVALQSLPAPLESGWQAAPGRTPPEEGEAWIDAAPGPWQQFFGAGYHGYGWYRIRFVLKGPAGHEPLGIELGRIRDADEAYLNGVLIGRSGRFPPRLVKATLHPRVYPLPASLLHRRGVNELRLLVFNHARSGGLMGGTPRIGRYRDLLRKQHRETLLTVAFAAFFFMVGANHFYLYLHRRQSTADLVFALFCSIVALYLTTFSPDLAASVVGMNMAFRLSVVLLPVAAGLFVLFMYWYFGVPRPAWLRVLVAAVFCDAAAALLWPEVTDLYAAVVVAELLMVPLMAAVLVCLAREVLRGGRSAAPIAIVITLMLVAVSYDVLVDLGAAPPPRLAVAGMVFPIGFLVFSVAMGLSLAERYWRYERAATYDPLTGVLRRQAFVEALERVLPRARREGRTVVVAMVDVDRFKQINDRGGHPCGDRALRLVAQRLQNIVRPADLVSRYGGDEFCVACEVDGRASGMAVLARIRDTVSRDELEVGSSKVALRVSVGAVVVAPDQHLGPVTDLLEQADRALYRAKSQGGGRFEVV